MTPNQPKSRRRRDEFSVSLKCFKLGIIDWNPDSKENANKDLTMANFKDFINHEEVNLSRAVKVDNGVGTLQGLTRDKISDSLVARVRYNKSNDHFEIDANVEERSSDDDFNDEWISASGPEREYIGRTFIDVTVGEEDEFKHGKVVEVVECDSFEGVYFQYYNHKRYPVQPTKDEMEQTACVEFPPWKKRGSDFIWDPEN